MAIRGIRIVTVVDYDPSWPSTFDSLRSSIAHAIGKLALSIEHVGSTAIPGLAAKPIIDIDIVVATNADVAPAIERLASIGYVHQSPSGLPAHHVYLCVQGATALENHLAVRAYLRKNPTAASAYGKLKKDLALQFPTAVDKYIEGKTAFLIQVLRENGFPDDVLTSIENLNRESRHVP
jgi:GrpB-like predicted nucleotidyltransferase (UPF0157 family)